MDNTKQICPECTAGNRWQANYCRNCGCLLIDRCPRCEFLISQGANYCDNCGLILRDPPGYNWWQFSQNGNQHTPSELSSRELFGRSERLNHGDDTSSPVVPEDREIGRNVSKVPLAAQPGYQLQQYIPAELLGKLEAARSSGEMVGERRVVTMLFCDVTGSTAAAEQLDPEEWTDIINGAFEQMIQPVYKYEGTVARLMGDGILAFFGAPIAHEDDPQRAILAGLDIIEGIKKYREEIRFTQAADLDVRVGINTGMVVVGNVGSDLRMEYTAIGDAINLAARMEQSAAPGSVQIAHDTHKLVKDLFEFVQLGEVEIKGKTEPVPAYRVVRRMAIARMKRGIEGLEVEMVGRKMELDMLQKVLADLNQGLGRIVCILGEAGVGKSRLVNEAKKIHQTLTPTGVDWYETVSLSYESNQAYGLIQRLIKNVHNLDSNDLLNELKGKSLSLSERQDGNNFRENLQFIQALFRPENEHLQPVLEGETFKAELLEAMQKWMRVQFGEKPSVLVFEDMHWGDSASVDLLSHLLPLSGEIPVVFVFIMRNERQTPSWKIKEIADADLQFRYIEIGLHPLTETESSDLIERLLAISEIPAQLKRVILDKSGGNPFFIEELVRTLIESGVVISEDRNVDGEMHRYWKASGEVIDLDIPDNLQSLLSARLDRLEESTRSTLQVASVIGRTFFHRVLQAVNQASQELDNQLSTLLKLEMIREASRLPELEYAFRNPLTQEAVYNTILLKNRRNFHKRVGEVMEKLYSDRLEDFYGLLAHHFTLAGFSDKAIEYTRMAAKQAVSLFAYEEAAQNLKSALSMVRADERPEIRILIYEELGDIYYLQRDLIQAITTYNQAIDWLENQKLFGPNEGMRIHRKIVQCSSEAKWNMDLESYRQARKISEHSRQRLEACVEESSGFELDPEQVRAMATLSFEAWRNQEPPQWEMAQEFAQAAVDKAEELDEPTILARALGALASVLDGRSMLREHALIAQRRLEASLDPRIKDDGEHLSALCGAGMALMYVGEYDQALPMLEEAELLAVNQHNIGQQVAALGLQSQCYFRMDRWDDVLDTEIKWRDLERRFSRQRVGPT